MYFVRFLCEVFEVQWDVLWFVVVLAMMEWFGDVLIWFSMLGFGVFWVYVWLDVCLKYYMYVVYWMVFVCV